MGWRRGRAGVAAALLALWMVPAALAADQGWLGVRIRDLSEQETEEISRTHGLREGFGAMIVEVIPDTPAAAAGLRSGDLVVALGDRPVVDTRALQRFVGGARAGEAVAVTVLRRDEGRRVVEVRLAAMPAPVAAEHIAAEFGFLVREAEAPGEPGGARPPGAPALSGVLPRSRAAAAGLRPGDVLVEVNGRPVVTLEAVREALLGVPSEAALPLVVRRGAQEISVVLEHRPAP